MKNQPVGVFGVWGLAKYPCRNLHHLALLSFPFPKDELGLVCGVLDDLQDAIGF